MDKHGLARAVTVSIHSDHRPVVDPFHRLQMNHPPIRFFVLKMKKPVFPRLARHRWGIYPGPLMWAVDGAAALIHHYFPLVGAVDVFRPQHQLPAGRNSARRCKEVVVAVAFVYLRPFNGGVSFVTIVHNNAFVQYLGTLGIQLLYGKDAFDSCPAPGPAVGQIHLPVVIPERTGVNQALCRLLPVPARSRDQPDWWLW